MGFPKTVAIVGAGNMGAGIAQKIAMEGFTVLLADMDLERATVGKGRIAASLEQAVARRVLSAPQAEATLARVTPVGGLQGLADADLVIEAVFENLLVKKELLRNLDAICKPECILASNTSSFYVGELASVTERPGKVVGLHYFFHPAKNRLLEVIPGHLTEPQVVADMERFAEAHGKTSILTKDAPGFAVNRFFVPWLNEAVRLMEEGTADIASIEAAAKTAFRIPMGPFELMNVTGVPVAMHAASTLGTELGPFYEPSEALITQGTSGDHWDLSGEVDTSVAEVVSDRLLGVVFQVAGALLDEKVCSLEDVDRGARIGLRWARGPFELMNRVGVNEALRLCQDLARLYDDLTPPQSVADQAATGAPWGFTRVDLKVEDGIAEIRLNRPEVMNALDAELVEQISARLDEALATEGLRGIILSGAGKAFVAGADISFFVRNIEAGTIEDIVSFTEAGQRLLRRIETAPVPVVARVHGMALGGGVELALACHAIVATEGASFTLPETGIGIYPGLGGTQRLPRIVGSPLARRLILTGRPLPALAAKDAGLVLEIAPLGTLDDVIRGWIDRGLPSRYPVCPAGADEATSELYGPSFSAGLLNGIAPGDLSDAARALLDKDLRAIGRKAPVALREACRLIDEGAGLDLEQALQLELDALPGIFATSDALTGLKSVTSREKPTWVGA
jgi:enoyl-CoA hydratase/3-hydroxyacyl-CoA dehydrogenase